MKCRTTTLPRRSTRRTVSRPALRSVKSGASLSTGWKNFSLSPSIDSRSSRECANAAGAAIRASPSTRGGTIFFVKTIIAPGPKQRRAAPPGTDGGAASASASAVLFRRLVSLGRVLAPLFAGLSGAVVVHRLPHLVAVFHHLAHLPHHSHHDALAHHAG